MLSVIQHYNTRTVNSSYRARTTNAEIRSMQRASWRVIGNSTLWVVTSRTTETWGAIPWSPILLTDTRGTRKAYGESSRGHQWTWSTNEVGEQAFRDANAPGHLEQVYTIHSYANKRQNIR